MLGRRQTEHNAAMPWMLYRYFMGELLRVFLLSATVLVLVVAFGAAIKPLAGDDLAGPLQVAKYITLAIVPMLQFAIPFSAGFAATLVMHRYTADNEILAASVSGLYFNHPDARYFSVGKLGRDQIEDYAARRSSDVETVERALAPYLGY